MARRVSLLAAMALAVVNASSACWGEVIPTTGLAAWLNADAITGLVDGGAVGTWANSASSGAMYDATASGAAQPLWYSNVLNGHAAVRFDGANQWMLMANTPMYNQADFTVFAVVQNASYGDPGRTILGNRNYQNGLVTGIQMSVWGASSLGLDINPHSLVYMNGPNAARNSIRSTPEDCVPLNEIQIASVGWVTGATDPASVYINGVGPQTLTPWNAATPDSVQGWEPTDLGLGVGWSSAAYSQDAARFDGYIAELIFYNGVLSETDRLAVQSYLGDKYGVVVPEPGSLALLATALLGLLCCTWRKK